VDVVIATFEDPRRAAAFSRALRRHFGVASVAIGEGTVGGYREPYDGHRLVAAWVPRGLAEPVARCAQRNEGVLHEPPARIRPPAWVVALRSSQEDAGAADGSVEASSDHRPDPS
jgi:hypothetical protein